MSPMRESLATAVLAIRMTAPEQPTPTPSALRPVIGSFRISAANIIAKIGSDVVTMAAFDGVVMLRPMVKQHWLQTSPNTPAPQSTKMSLSGTCSCLVKSDVIQKNTAPPRARRYTIFRLSTPFSIASLPIGAMRPQMTQAERMARWAISTRLFCIASIRGEL